jgi:hypothetical protein
MAGPLLVVVLAGFERPCTKGWPEGYPTSTGKNGCIQQAQNGRKVFSGLSKPPDLTEE